jgi:hypothetical protein
MYIQSLHSTITNGNTYLDVVADKIGKLTIKVVDVHGMIAKKLTTLVEEGSQQLDLNFADLNNGNYILNAFNGDVFLKSIPFSKL